MPLGKTIVFNHADAFRVRRFSSGLLALFVSCGAVGSVMGVAGYVPPFWEETTLAVASSLGLLLVGTRHYVARLVIDRNSGLVAVRGHKLLGDVARFPTNFRVQDLHFHGENRFGIFFRSQPPSALPRLWFIPKRRMVVADRGLTMPLPEMTKDFSSTGNAHCTSAASMKLLEHVKIGKDGAWATEEDERRFVVWLKNH